MSFMSVDSFSSTNNERPFVRLPNTVVPSSYDIKIKPNLINLTFTGSENISIDIRETIDEIVLNAYDLEINRATYKADGSDDRIEGEVTTNSIDQIARIKFGRNLGPGSGKLHLKFIGYLDDDMKGFYRCKLWTGTGEEGYSASTQFGFIFARRAFPCLDEPAIKATFKITLIVRKDLKVLSNTSVLSDEPFGRDHQLKIVKFDQTPPMSTFLVAFVVGQYDHIETMTESGIPVRVYALGRKKNRGTFALETAAKCLTFFENYFGIPYPLDKIDHVAVSQFLHGAMGNWGLITYRENMILESRAPNSDLTYCRQNIALILSHETVHQWIGNLVTVEWWDHFKINEGLATFMQYLAIADIYPQFDIWSKFAHRSTLPALDSDSWENMKPLEVSLGCLKELQAVLERKYNRKGASIFRMCHDWIGDENFKKGIQDYLARNAYKTAVCEDLWNAFEKVSNKPVKRMMSTWTKQQGFPVVQVSSKTKGNRRILTLTQEPILTEKLLDDEEEQILWCIPISVVTSRNPEEIIVSTLMETRTMGIPIDDLAPTDWVKINPKVIGYYQVIYSSDMLKLLKPAIRNKQIPLVERLQILNDHSTLLRNDRVAAIDVLRLLSYYEHEDDLVIWRTIETAVTELTLAMNNEPLMRSVVLKICANMYSRLGFVPLPNEEPSNGYLRTLILDLMIQFDDENIIAEAKRKFIDHCNGEFLEPEVEGIVLEVMGRYLSENFGENRWERRQSLGRIY